MKYLVFFLILSCTFQFVNSCYKVDDVIDTRDDCYIDYKVDSSNGQYTKYLYKNKQLYGLVSDDVTQYFIWNPDTLFFYELFKNRTSFYKFTSYRENANTIILNTISDTFNHKFIYKLKNNLVDTVYEIYSNNRKYVSEVFAYNPDNTIKKVISNSMVIYEYEYYNILDIYSFRHNIEFDKFFKLSTKFNLIKSIIKKDTNSNILNSTYYTYVIDSSGKLKHSSLYIRNHPTSFDYTYHCD